MSIQMVYFPQTISLKKLLSQFRKDARSSPFPVLPFAPRSSGKLCGKLASEMPDQNLHVTERFTRTGPV